MTATMQSEWCQATTDKTHYAPYPDWIEVDIDIRDKAWYAQCSYVAITVTVDSSTTYYTATLLNYTGVKKWEYVPTDPGDNELHSYQFSLRYYQGGSTGTLLGSENVYNYYNPSSRYYYMRGHMGSFAISETEYSQSVTYLQPNNGYVYWYFHPRMNSSYPAIDVAHDFMFTYNGGAAISYLDNRAVDYIEWAYWGGPDEYYNSLAVKTSGQYKLSARFTYYDGSRDNVTNQYTPKTYSWSNAHTFIVYENLTKPLLDISTVYSSNINNPSQQTVLDVAPYEGKAPYRVTWTASANTTEHPYALPVSSIVWNFGDPDSGGDNQSTTYNYSITRSHTYPDYESRTCTITVTDVVGNVNSATARFSPSTKQRQFKNPTLTPQSGTQPLLCTGDADIAGSPYPVPIWTYTHQTQTSYTGTVTGDHVELSLLKSGTYSVVYSVALEGITTTRTFTVSVSAGTVTPDDSQSMHNFDLIILDSSGNAIDWCKQHTSIQYIEYYQDLDVFSFEIPATYSYAQYLQEGNYLIIGYNGKARLMQVTYRGRNGDRITISGESAFPERIAITATRSTANEGYDVQSYKGESLVRYFIQACLTDPYPDAQHSPSTQPRGADFVVFGADGEQGGNVTYSARYDRLRDIINEVCKSANIGYTITARQAGLKKAGMSIVVGTDRTYTSGGANMVIFSPKRLMNCTIESDQGSMARNVSIGAGAGTGNYRTYQYTGTETATGFDRRELFTDAGDSADAAEVTRMSNLALMDDRQMSIRIRVLPTCQWIFGTDYHVGDIVTIESPDRGNLDLQIYSAESCRRATGDELYLNLGYECASAPTLIRRTAKENTYARK